MRSALALLCGLQCARAAPAAWPLQNAWELFEQELLRREHQEYARFKAEIQNRTTVEPQNVTVEQLNSISDQDGSSPVQLIVDTDLGFDVDDVGAVAIANHLQDIGRCKILAVVHNTGFYKGIGGVDVVDHYYGRTHLELGAYRGAWGSSSDAQNAQDRYTSTIERNYPSPIQNAGQVYTAVEAYQKVLEAAEDGSVVIASIGELTNLRDILKADAALFGRKVQKVVYMDGGYNFGCGDSKGSGWSPWLGSTNDCDGAAQYVQEHVPHNVKQVFTLNGGDVLTGSRFNDGCGAGPVKEAYQIWTGEGSRPSWDLIAVYLAVMGDTSLFSSRRAGTDYVDFHGNENFDTSNTGNNEYQVWIDGSRNGDVTRMLDDMICSSPCRGDADVGACAGYTMHSGRNCYGDRDGRGSHGADDLEHPASASCGKMSLAACQKRCDETEGCDGVTVTPTNDGLVECYRKANINIGQCDYGNAWGFDTWVKKTSSSVKTEADEVSDVSMGPKLSASGNATTRARTVAS